MQTPQTTPPPTQTPPPAAPNGRPPRDWTLTLLRVSQAGVVLSLLAVLVMRILRHQ